MLDLVLPLIADESQRRVIVSMKRDEVIFSIRSYLSIIVKAISLEIDLSNDCRTMERSEGSGSKAGAQQVRERLLSMHVSNLFESGRSIAPANNPAVNGGGEVPARVYHGQRSNFLCAGCHHL